MSMRAEQKKEEVCARAALNNAKAQLIARLSNVPRSSLRRLGGGGVKIANGGLFCLFRDFQVKSPIASQRSFFEF